MTTALRSSHGRVPGHGRVHGDESGTVVLWLLGLCVLVLGLGGISVDLWRGFSERRAVAAIADAAAFAGASGIDETAYRAAAEVRLDPVLAGALAESSLTSQAESDLVTGWRVEVLPAGTAVTVTVESTVRLGLLRLLAPGEDVVRIRVTSTAEPRLAD